MGRDIIKFNVANLPDRLRGPTRGFCFTLINICWTGYGEECNDTVLPAKSDSDGMFCLQSYQGFITDRSLVY